MWVIQRPMEKQESPTPPVPSPQIDTKPTTADDGEATVVHRNTTTPPSTASETPFKVQVKLPHGMTANNLQVRVQDRVLYIAGEQRTVSENLVRTTSFARQFPVDESVDTDKVSAVINAKGVLVVTAPKKVNALPAPTAETTHQSKESAKVTFAEPPVPTAPSTEVTEQERKPTPTEQTAAPADMSEPPVEPPVLVPFKLQVSQNDDKAFALTVELPPGVTAKDLDLQVTAKGVLSISGEQRKEYNGSVLTSKFVRHFTLDKTAEVDKIQATLDDATRKLTVTVPKKSVEKPVVQKITIHVGEAPSVTKEDPKDKSDDKLSVEKADEGELKTLSESPTEAKSQSDESSTDSKDESWTNVEQAAPESDKVAAQVVENL